MGKTAPEIEQELYDIAAPFFRGLISGSVYLSDTRPADSHTEDVVVCQPATGSSQFPQGRARFLLFVPDIDTGCGHMVPDKARIQRLTSLHAPLLAHLNSCQDTYIFEEFGDAAPTGRYPDALEHFIDFQYSFTNENF